MNTNKKRILIIGENEFDNSFIADDFTSYEVRNIVHNDNLVGFVEYFMPTIIIFDLNTITLKDYYNCVSLNQNHKIKNIPIIFITNHSNNFDVSEIIEAGAIDVIEKPYNKKILISKINNYIKMYNSIVELEEYAVSARELNPNTSLPGNTAIKRNIQNAIYGEEELVVVYADLDNFKAYNDKYGFSRGDDVIKLTADIIQIELSKYSESTFLGHIGGDDFVFIAPKKRINEISKNIITDFTNSIKKYYNEEDLNTGYIVSKSRKEIKQKFPIMTISLGGVDISSFYNTLSYNEVIDLCTESKKLAKANPKSCFVLKDKITYDVSKANYVAALSSAI